jgi:hypothetical protein
MSSSPLRILTKFQSSAPVGVTYLNIARTVGCVGGSQRHLLLRCIRRRQRRGQRVASRSTITGGSVIAWPSIDGIL